MDRAYYLKYFDFEKNHWWFRARAEILQAYLRRTIKPKSRPRILNVGAATGGSIAWLSQLGDLTSLEFDSESVEFIRNHLKEKVTQGSILSLPYAEGEFDIVCAFDVIEHVENDKLAVSELNRVCRPGGSVLVTVPAHMHLWNVHDEVNHHFRRYAMTQLRELWTGTSGKIEFASFFNNRFYIPIAVIRKFSSFASRIRKQKQLKSDFESFSPGKLNEWLFSIMAGEKTKIERQIPYRLGVSIILHWRKA
jgi:SAM-dependent methyltransferase